MRPIKEYLRWRRQPNIGCMFARLIANDPTRFNQVVIQVPTKRAPNIVARDIADRITKFVDDQGVDAVALIFPDITTLERAAEIFFTLGKQPKWSVQLVPLQHATAGNIFAVRLSRNIPFKKGECSSEALVLGPYSIFPPTRRAPYTALEIYVGKPRENDPKTGQPTEKANLAHMEMNLPTDEAFDAVWKISRDGRLTSLGKVEDNRAKAKVAFVITAALVQNLGLAT